MERKPMTGALASALMASVAICPAADAQQLAAGVSGVSGGDQKVPK